MRLYRRTAHRAWRLVCCPELDTTLRRRVSGHSFDTRQEPDIHRCAVLETRVSGPEAVNWPDRDHGQQEHAVKEGEGHVQDLVLGDDRPRIRWQVHRHD